MEDVLIVAFSILLLNGFLNEWSISKFFQLWEKQYIHPNYFNALNGSMPILEICQDVYDFPLMSERFCAELIEECEYYGKWSDGKHKVFELLTGCFTYLFC